MRESSIIVRFIIYYYEMNAFGDVACVICIFFLFCEMNMCVCAFNI